MEKKKGYKKLIVWKEAHNFVLQVYKISSGFPKEDMYGLTSQLRRAAVSIPNNIVEGQASNSKKDFLHFLNIANKSLAETNYLLELSKDLKYLSSVKYRKLEEECKKIGYLLSRLRKSIQP